MKIKGVGLIKNLWLDFVASIPGGLGGYIRYIVYKKKFKKVAGKFYIGSGVTITGFENIELGKNVSISKNSYLYAAYNGESGGLIIGDNFFMGTNTAICANRGNITIGNNVLIAQNVVLRPDNHVINDISKPIRECGNDVGSIVIGDDVWIAANCVILKDVVLGGGCVVAAGAVVNKSVDSYSVVGGVPAKFIKKRV